MTVPSRANLQAALSAHGLRLRGGWMPSEADAIPALPLGQPAAVVWMVGVAASEFWPYFKASGQYQEYLQDDVADPLDRWSRAIGDELASQWGGVALYPFDGPPYHPFQQWATRAEPLQASPLMLRIHPEHGLWHAYRFALALPELMPGDLASISPPLPVPNFPSQHICLTCDGQPCLSVCPVDAYTGSGFQLNACARHLHTPSGNDCMSGGCLARRACPIGRESRYAPEHAAFHMQAFAVHHDGKNR